MTPKSPEEIMREYFEVEDYGKAEWLKSALASVILWAAKEAKNEPAELPLGVYQYGQDAVMAKNENEGLKYVGRVNYNKATKDYYDALIALSEEIK